MSQTVKWITEGSAIDDFTGYDNLIYQNGVVKGFLTNPEKYFIIAGKGIGKTILLKYKRYLMEKNPCGRLFLPSDRPHIGFVENLTRTLSLSKIRRFSEVEFCENFWRVAIQIYLLSSSSISKLALAQLKRDVNSIMSSSVNFEKHFDFLLQDKRGMGTICNYLISIVGESDLQKLFDVSYLITGLLTADIQEPIIYFFDRFDQSLKYSDASVWLSMQQGLLEAAWNIMNANPHVKIYLSLRQEAYDAHHSINKQAMANNISLISYSGHELIDLIEQLVHYYEGRNSLKEFLGIDNFNNTVTHTDEPVYQFMNRYSIGRPRDFVTFCGKLSERVDDKFKDNDERAEKLKEIIITSSSSDIISGLHEEVSMLLTCLKTRDEFDNFIKRFSHNVLTYNELQKYCAEYNNSICSKNCSDCRGDSKKKHPFCDLYIMGLLGKIKRINDTEQYRQVFKSPYDDITKAKIIYGESEYYLVHPALRNYIESLNGNYKLYDGLLIGDNCPWTEKHSKITIIHKEIDDIKNDDIKNFLDDRLAKFAQNITQSYSQLNSEYTSAGLNTTLREKRIVDIVLQQLSCDKNIDNKKNNKISVFVVYAFKNAKQQKRVISFTNELRKMGFDATMDVFMKNEYPNIDELMTAGLTRDKVIVVLSEKYKEKADGRTGGVWKEFRMIANDLEKNEKKYIFVSFDSYSGDLPERISPKLIGNRWIVDIKKDKQNDFNELVSYITDENIYPFVEVNNNTRTVIKKPIEHF